MHDFIFISIKSSNYEKYSLRINTIFYLKYPLNNLIDCPELLERVDFKISPMH